jgi:hypothetical protein
VIIKLAPFWKITNLGAGVYDITASPNVERISINHRLMPTWDIVQIRSERDPGRLLHFEVSGLFS